MTAGIGKLLIPVNPKVARLVCCSVIETPPVTVGSSAVNSRILSTRAFVDELSRVSNPILVLSPLAIASSSVRLNEAGVASPTGVLPLNCAKRGTNVQKSVASALRTVNLCLIVNNFVDDCPRQESRRAERGAGQMHTLQQRASLI